MSGHLTSVLWAWAALSPFLFRLLPGRDAATACLVLGWAFLPVAPFSPSDIVPPGPLSTVQSVSIPATAPANKATAIGLGCLLGLVAFDARTFVRVRFTAVDLPIAALCLVPLASMAANGLPLADGLGQVRYLALAWGAPYLMGRAYLADEESRGRFAVGVAAGGLAYLPICLLEVVAGPIAYRFAYGSHPYEFEGAARSLGYRPLGFQEHGNQLGIWMAGSALVATWLWASGAARRLVGLPGGVVAAILVGATLACQSHGSIVLLGLALVPLAFARASGDRARWLRFGLVALTAAAIAAGMLVAARAVAAGSLRAAVRGIFLGISKSSFTWRLARFEDFLPIAWQRPWLGWGRPDWGGEGHPLPNPVNLAAWLLWLGMYGSIGLLAVLATWLVPPIRSALRDAPRSWCGPSRGATGALVALVAIQFLDEFANAAAVLPVVAALGGLNRPARGPGPAA